MPGEGAGRREEVGRTGVYPASGPLPPENATYQPMASFGQGERGAAGYADSGTSEISKVEGQQGIPGLTDPNQPAGAYPQNEARRNEARRNEEREPQHTGDEQNRGARRVKSGHKRNQENRSAPPPA